MSILALDLGTRTGWAWGDGKGVVLSGTWDFSTKRHEGGGMKYRRFLHALADISSMYPIGELYFEEVRRHAGTAAAHVYGGFKSHLENWCEGRVPYQSVPVGEIKKFWTGKGNATKEAMIAEAVRRGFEPIDDNEADALAILHLKGGA